MKKEIKTIIFASLIMAMILPFSGMNFANAEESSDLQEECSEYYPDFCIPPTPDVNCSDLEQRNFTVLSPDPHRLDGNGDGIGCESNSPNNGNQDLSQVLTQLELINQRLDVIEATEPTPSYDDTGLWGFVNNLRTDVTNLIGQMTQVISVNNTQDDSIEANTDNIEANTDNIEDLEDTADLVRPMRSQVGDNTNDIESNDDRLDRYIDLIVELQIRDQYYDQMFERVYQVHDEWFPADPRD